jgi:hypothetical protein
MEVGQLDPLTRSDSGRQIRLLQPLDGGFYLHQPLDGGFYFGRQTRDSPPSARKVDASPSRPFQPPGGLMESIDASLQRGRQG